MSKIGYFILIIMSAMSLAQVKNIGGVKTKLIDNFEDGDVKSMAAGTWLAANDHNEGGNSLGRLSVVPGGYGLGNAIRLEYSFGSGYRHQKNGQFKQPFTFLALGMKEQLFQTRDLSEYKGICFRIKQKGDYLALIICKKNGQMELFQKSFSLADNSWATKVFSFGEFAPLANKSVMVDARSVMFIAISAQNRQRGSFMVDDFAFVLKSKKEKLISGNFRFGQLKIKTPDQHWKWETEKEHSKLSYSNKVIMSFFGLPMRHKNRIPFSDGLSADPGNTKELLECTIHELERLRFFDIKKSSIRKIRLKYFKSKRFVFSAKMDPILMRHLQLSNTESNRVYLQVDFIKYRSTTYEIITFMPMNQKKKMLSKTSRIIYNLRKYQ